MAYKVVSGGIELEPHEYSVRDLTKGEKITEVLKSFGAAMKKHPALAATAAAAPVIGSALLLGKKKEDNFFKKQQKSYQKNKEEEQNKAASDILDEMVKEAATVKDVWRTEKLINTVPRPSGLIKKMNEPENFAYGKKTRTRIRPDDAGNEFGYTVCTSGGGRKNQQLDAATYLKDIVRMSHDSDEGAQKDYDDRVQPFIDRYKSTPSIRFIAKGRRAKNIVKALTDEERDELVKMRHNYGKKHTNNARSAHSLEATNTTIIYC